MIDVELTKTRLAEGVWEGVLSASGKGKYKPDIEVTHMDQPLENVDLSKEKGKESWVLRIPVPMHLIADGVQTFLIRDRGLNQVLGDFTMIAGDALSYDIRAEVNLLREELDMLKRSYRRHCRETT